VSSDANARRVAVHGLGVAGGAAVPLLLGALETATASSSSGGGGGSAAREGQNREAAVSERFPLIPLQYWSLTPELQWQSRGKWRILQGCQRETVGVGCNWAGGGCTGGGTLPRPSCCPRRHS
jgi:hypothetical protein